VRTEDGYIINKCLNGEAGAFGLLVDKYKEGVYSLAYYKLRNFEDAEDVTQEVFIKVYRNLHALKSYDNFMAWIHSITSNLCKNHIRNQSRRPDREYIDDKEPELTDNLSKDSYRDVMLKESLHEALNSLPDVYRQVLTLHYLGGMKVLDIAKVLGSSERTIARRLSEAKLQIKEEMLAMMSETYKQHKLPVGFTFRIAEIVRRIKINPISTTKSLPWGLSLATGIIFTIMSFSPNFLPFKDIGAPIFSSLQAESKVLKVGEIPVDVVKSSNISFISSFMGKGKGGELKPDMKNAFMAPQVEGGEWAKKADMPTARGSLSTSVVNGKIYAIGGTANGTNSITTVEEYDPITDIWTKKADMPIATAAHTASVVKGKIYIIGGGQIWGNSIPTVEEYDPIADKWVKKADMPTARGMLCSGVVNEKIYAIGGSKQIWGDSLSTVEEYDPIADKWAKKADMPTARGWLSASVANGKIYVFGGENGGELSTVEEYDPIADKWAKKADMPTARNGLSTSTVDGKIYAISGDVGGNQHLTIVEEYNPETDTWIRKADILIARDTLSTSVADGKIYAIGGYINGPISAVEEYTPEGWQPQSISPQGKISNTWGKIKAK
jgi:RNA polymerase sigma factor (sigma-70 family)